MSGVACQGEGYRVGSCLEKASMEPLWSLEKASMEPLFLSRFEAPSRLHLGSNEASKRRNRGIDQVLFAGSDQFLDGNRFPGRCGADAAGMTILSLVILSQPDDRTINFKCIQVLS